MQRARDELFARAGFAADQHRRIGIGGKPDGLLHPAHRFAGADQSAVANPAAVAPLTPAWRQPLDQLTQRIPADRLEQMIEGAEPHRFDRVLRACIGGQHDHRRRVAAGADAAQGLDAVDPGHAEVEQHGIGVGRQHADRFAAGGRRHGAMTEIRHRLRETVAQRGVVIDDQDGCHGREISKLLP